MIFDTIIAKKLEVLIHPDVETALNLLFDYVLHEKETIFDNPSASDAELRQFQGQKTLLKELKQYKIRLKDSIIREKERKDNVKSN